MKKGIGVGIEDFKKIIEEDCYYFDKTNYIEKLLKDKTNVKLTRALMVGIGDGSTNIHHGDSLRESKWEEDFNGIQNTLKEEDIQLC